MKIRKLTESEKKAIIIALAASGVVAGGYITWRLHVKTVHAAVNAGYLTGARDALENGGPFAYQEAVKNFIEQIAPKIPPTVIYP